MSLHQLWIKVIVVQAGHSQLQVQFNLSLQLKIKLSYLFLNNNFQIVVPMQNTVVKAVEEPSLIGHYYMQMILEWFYNRSIHLLHGKILANQSLPPKNILTIKSHLHLLRIILMSSKQHQLKMDHYQYLQMHINGNIMLVVSIMIAMMIMLPQLSCQQDIKLMEPGI